MHAARHFRDCRKTCRISPYSFTSSSAVGSPGSLSEFRHALAFRVRERLNASKLNQRQLGKKLGLSQPQIAQLFHGKSDLVALDDLIEVLRSFGVAIDVVLRSRSRSEKPSIRLLAVFDGGGL